MPPAVVSRQADLDRIAELLSQGGALLHGPAGIGKSVLLRSAAASAGRRGEVALVEGNESSGLVPLDAFTALLPLEELPADRDPARVAAAVRRRLEGVALLAVDDESQQENK